MSHGSNALDRCKWPGHGRGWYLALRESGAHTPGSSVPKLFVFASSAAWYVMVLSSL